MPDSDNKDFESSYRAECDALKENLRAEMVSAALLDSLKRRQAEHLARVHHELVDGRYRLQLKLLEHVDQGQGPDKCAAEKLKLVIALQKVLRTILHTEAQGMGRRIPELADLITVARRPDVVTQQVIEARLRLAEDEKRTDAATRERRAMLANQREVTEAMREQLKQLQKQLGE